MPILRGKTRATSAGVGPSERYAQTMVYDLANRRAVLFGGWCNGALSDTWVYRIASNACTLADVANALSAAGGWSATGAGDVARLDVIQEGGSAGRLDMNDACRLAREAAGLEPNP